jgi:hypothetical protein
VLQHDPGEAGDIAISVSVLPSLFQNFFAVIQNVFFIPKIFRSNKQQKRKTAVNWEQIDSLGISL